MTSDDGRIDRFGFMENVRRNVQDFAGANEQFLRFVVTNPELETAFEDVRQLFVLVLVLGNDASLFQVHVRQHHPVARDQATVEEWRHGLARNVVPGIPRHRTVVRGGHRDS